MSSEKAIQVWLRAKPSTLDPLHFDSFQHHITQRPVFITLVTLYSKGEIKGLLANGWVSSDDFKVWKFHLRKDLTFENGDPITPETVIQSLKRMAYLMKFAGSQSGIFEKLVGYDSFNSINAPFPGISQENGMLVFRFQTPMKRLLELISFGLYGIVHPANYDPISGAWINKKKAIASGPYYVSSWTNESYYLRLRDNFPRNLIHHKPFSEYKMVWNPLKRESSDIIMGGSIENITTHHFIGPAIQNILYVQCLSWAEEDSFCNNRTNRIMLREDLYRNLRETGTEITRSFFPLSISGVSEISFENISHSYPTVSSFRKNYKFLHNPYPFSILKKIRAKLMDITAKAGISMDDYQGEWNILGGSDPQLSSNVKNRLVDFVAIITGILIDSPKDDIQFMILSKEGIRLPDPTGELASIVSKDEFSVQEVNEVIMRDAVVWPICHLSLGLWIKSDNIDLSKINVSQPPTDLSLIGMK